MRFAIIVGLALSALSPHVSAFCLTDAEASTVGNNFAQLVSNYTLAFANATIASTFSDQTDSVITLMDSASQPQVPVALGSLTFPSKAAYIAGQSAQANIPFTILNTWHDCKTVIIRWRSAQTPQEVQGFTAIGVVQKTPYGSIKPQYLINQTYGEFNSAAWLVNLGNPQCGGNSTA